MDLDFNDLENMLFDYIDQFKVLISQDTWENILLNCTKNEMLVLMLLYRRSEVNMTMIAEYINVPLNTATGIVARMEKKEMVLRERSVDDKRVVTIVLTEIGKTQINSIIKAYMDYGQRIIASLSMDEISLLGSLISKVTAILQEEKMHVAPLSNKVRKITIE